MDPFIVLRTRNSENARRRDQRCRELYRYFQPANPAALLDPQYSPEIIDPIGTAGPSSPNTTLTSFAQLAALRLNAQRALISVVDREAEYCLAEATKTLNLRDSACLEIDHENDALWVGCSRRSQFGGQLCRNTLALLPSDKNCYPIFTVPDLSQDDAYKKLPCVAGPPHFRFYAGTPLTTENKINIGVFFVFDDQPRGGLTDMQRDALGMLANLVMDFLRVSRQASEGRRAARLSRGLSCFVEGSSSFVDGVTLSRATSSARASVSPPPAVTGGSRGSGVDIHNTPSPSRSQNGDGDGTSQFSAKAESGETATKSDVTTPLSDWLGSITKGNPDMSDETHSHLWAFRRAANLIRESLELTGDSGVIFLESSNSPLDEDPARDDYFSDKVRPAPVLAISTGDEPFAPEPGSTVACPAATVDRRFLQQVLRRYPKGKLWSFHRDGSVSTSDDDDKSRLDSPVSVVKERIPRGVGKKWKSAETTLLGNFFPNASQVLFVPLWNAASSQWFAGCFCWNGTETQVFCPAVELASIMGFGYSIMAECSRVESVIADRQKGDFIGNISHELRSPLHGILAAAEFMDGTRLSEFQKSLLDTINACGRTLLDTMNQVLDFSKIVSLEKSWRQLKRAHNHRRDVKDGNRGMAARLDSHTLEDIALLAEEVVEGVCLGHSYGQVSAARLPRTLSGNISLYSGSAERKNSVEQSNTSDVEVVIDIVPGNWIYKTQPGALRRIIMNIFGNAMKYTEHGQVTLRLETVHTPEMHSGRQDPGELVVLTVTDTGKGISEDFLRARLYTPFAQEDTLAVGTGLGLSIVRSIVKSLDGHISVHSKSGEGTTVKVSLPLVRPVDDDDSAPCRVPLSSQGKSPDDMDFLRQECREKTIAVLGLGPDSAGTSGFWHIITAYITNWFGLNLVSWPSSTPVDLLVADEKDLINDGQQCLGGRPLALLVLCHRSIDHGTHHLTWSSIASPIEFLHRPCGPHKLAKNIVRCLKRLPSSNVASFPESGSQPMTLVDLTYFDSPEPCPNSNAEEDPALFDGIADAPEQTVAMNATGSASSHHDLALPAREGLLGRRSAPEVPRVLSERNEIPGSVPLLPDLAERTAYKSPSLKVLVVDDNQINLRLMLTFMRRRKLTVLESADNGKIAVDAVERNQQGYDIIFMDISMPVMNGFEATRAIRALERERDGCRPATIIALTGLSSARDETEALTSGVDLFLTKPVSFKEVSRLLDEWEAKHQDG